MMFCKTVAISVMFCKTVSISVRQWPYLRYTVRIEAICPWPTALAEQFRKVNGLITELNTA